jgi:hypothetical protein
MMRGVDGASTRNKRATITTIRSLERCAIFDEAMRLLSATKRQRSA